MEVFPDSFEINFHTIAGQTSLSSQDESFQLQIGDKSRKEPHNVK